MTTPVIEAGDINSGGNDSAESPISVTYPAYSTGDLVIMGMATDGGTVTHTIPGTGDTPNGESVVTIEVNVDNGRAGGPIASGFYYIATSNEATGSIDITVSASEQNAWGCIVVPAGEFDETTPIQSSTGKDETSGSGDTTVSTPAWTSDAAPNGRIVSFIFVDTDTVSGSHTGWTVRENYSATTRVKFIVTTRDAANTASESITAADYTIAGDTWVSFGFVVNEPVASGDIAGSTSIAFTDPGTSDLNGKGSLQAAASVGFAGTPTILGSGRLQASVTIAITQTATLVGKIVAQASTSIALGETATLIGSAALQASPAIDWGGSDTLTGKGQLQAAASIDFTASGTLLLPGKISASTSIAFSETGTVTGTGLVAGTAIAAFSATGTLFGRAAAQGAASVSFAVTADLINVAVMKGDWGSTSISPLILPIRTYVFAPQEQVSAAVSIDFSDTATLTAKGVLQGSTSLNWSANGAPVQPRPLDLSPLILPISRYDFLSPKLLSLAGSTSISFGHLADLTSQGGLSPDNIFGVTSINDVFDTYVWIQGKGQLLGSASVVFGGIGIADPNAVKGGATIAFDSTAMLTVATGGIGPLIGSESMDFSALGNVFGTHAAQGSEVIAFSATGNLENATGVKLISGSAVIRISAGGSKFIQMAGSTSIDFATTATVNAVTFGEVEKPSVVLLGVDYDVELLSDLRVVRLGSAPGDENDPIIDGFNRPGPSLGPDWADMQLPGYIMPIIRDNSVAAMFEVITGAGTYWAGEQLITADQFVEVELKNWVWGDYDAGLWIWLRATGGLNNNSGYYLYFSGSDTFEDMYLDIHRWDSPDVYTWLDGFEEFDDRSVPDGSKLVFQAVGNTLTGWLDRGAGAGPEHIIQVVDATYPSQLGVGFGIEHFVLGTGDIDTFRAGPISQLKPAVKEYSVVLLEQPLAAVRLGGYDVIKLGE